VAAIAVVGDDEPGSALIAALDARGIDTGRIVSAPGYRTPTKVRILGGGRSSLKHQVARYDIEDVLARDGQWRSSLREHLSEEIRIANAIAISDYGYGCVQTEVLQDLGRPSGPPPWLCLDSRYRIASFTGIDGATPNLEELEAHCGRRLQSDDEVAAGAEELRRDLDARFLLATRGNRGMTLVEAGCRPLHIPVYGTDEVADVTGAGDTVLAVLTAALATGAEPAVAAGLANIAAGLVVMKLGTATVSAVELRAAVESA
jgi:rfaE bifunctional protein kinase chain/domain